MSKARDLADFVSDGNPLADGTISVSEVSGAAPTASPTFTGDATFDTDTLAVDSTNNRVGIGTSSPSVTLDARLGTTTGKVAELHNSVGYGIGFTVEGDGGVNTINAETNQALAFATNGASNERMRIDSSGHLLFAKTSTSSGVAGIRFAGDAPGYAEFTRDGGNPLFLNRETSHGDIIRFAKDNSYVGSIGSSTNTEITFAGLDAGVGIIDHAVVPTQGDTLLYRNDNEVDLGRSDTRFKDLYLSGGILADGISTVSTIRENVTTDSTTSGTLNISLLGTSVRYLTANQTANRTLNFRGDVSTSLNSVMAVGESITTAVLATQGSTAYYFNTIQIDTTGVTPKWQGGSAPTGGNASGIDAYSFTIIKTADATFTVLASQTQFA